MTLIFIALMKSSEGKLAEGIWYEISVTENPLAISSLTRSLYSGSIMTAMPVADSKVIFV